MMTPCEWAAKAADKQGTNFTIKAMKGGASGEVHLVHVQQMSSGGYTMSTFSFAGPGTGPKGDGMYTISGGGLGETEVFMVEQSMPNSENTYILSLACKS